jgi:PASTA domain
MSRPAPRATPPELSDQTERECPACGTVAVNQDFCPCGEYLGWEASITPAPAPEPASHRPPEPPEPRPATLLTLRDPTREDDPSAAVSLTVVPGLEVMALATVRNQGEIVDTFDVRVDGLPEAWWTVASSTVFLNPWGTSGEYQRELRVQLHPPRAAESEARAWPFTVVVRSRTLGADVAWVPATLTVQPFQSTVMRVAPERRIGRRHASFDVKVWNRGNSPAEIVIGARDTEARCPVTITPARTMVPVGGSVAAVVRTGVPRPLIFRRPVDHYLDISHGASGADEEPIPQRVTFRQKPWLPWWVPAVVALIAAFIAAVLLLRRDTEVPKLKGDTVEEAVVVLDKHHLELGRTTYETAPKGVPLGTILDQAPAAGDAVDKGERVNITIAAAARTGLVPPVNGLTLAKAADALTAAHFAYDPQPSSAGNDWVVIRQQPTPGTKLEHGAKVTLAVENRAATATPTATPTPSATAAPTPSAAAKPKPAAAKAVKARAAKAPAPPALPADLVFADATKARLYRWPSGDAKPAGLTSRKYRLEMPTRTDEGYVAVEDGRRLVRISADGKTVTPIARGDYHRPVYSAQQSLVAVISADGRDDPADAGELCVLDPQDARPSACAAAGRHVGRPSWTPNGRSVLVLATGPDGNYNEILSYAATGTDAAQWAAPTSVYRWEDIQAAVPVGNDRIAVLVADSPGAPAHLRLLARRANGRFAPVKDFPALTGFELAATGRHLALRRGSDANGDGPIVLLDVDRAQPRLGRLGRGANPAWAS